MGTELKDYQLRFVDEYRDLKDKCEKLHKLVVKYDAGTLDFTPSCSCDLLSTQLEHMMGYLYILEVRAEIEGIDLSLYL